MNKNWTLLILGVTLIMLFSLSISAQPPDPPPPPGGHGHNGNAPAGAPIDGGLGILLAMGAAYGGKKVWKKIWSIGE
ncbi:PID-CTERM protein-sorting domain-containing protein [Bacteroidota bacterium]